MSWIFRAIAFFTLFCSCSFASTMRPTFVLAWCTRTAHWIITAALSRLNFCRGSIVRTMDRTARLARSFAAAATLWARSRRSLARRAAACFGVLVPAHVNNVI